MADARLNEIIHTAWNSAGIGAGEDVLFNALSLIYGQGTNFDLFHNLPPKNIDRLYHGICPAAKWTPPTMCVRDMARIWIACNFMHKVSARDTLFNLAKAAFGQSGIGTNRYVRVCK